MNSKVTQWRSDYKMGWKMILSSPSGPLQITQLLLYSWRVPLEGPAIKPELLLHGWQQEFKKGEKRLEKHCGPLKKSKKSFHILALKRFLECITERNTQGFHKNVYGINRMPEHTKISSWDNAIFFSLSWQNPGPLMEWMIKGLGFENKVSDCQRMIKAKDNQKQPSNLQLPLRRLN